MTLIVLGLALFLGLHLIPAFPPLRQRVAEALGSKLAGTILFGAFFAYSVVDLVSAIARHAFKPFEPACKYDAMAIGGGLILAALTIYFHPAVFGTAPVA